MYAHEMSNIVLFQVLSVVAQQILSILSALAAGSTRFVFEGREINLIWSCGIFITMNPGECFIIPVAVLPAVYCLAQEVCADNTYIAHLLLF